MLGRFLLLLAVFCLTVPPAAGADGPSLSLDPISPSPDARVLTIYSSLDSKMALPLLAAFQAERPSIGIDFHEMQTQDIYARIISETDRAETTADLAFSSAMDLQVKLANDGYAQAVRLPAAEAIPTWAQWRHSVYGVTFEPAVILYHKPSFAAAHSATHTCRPCTLSQGTRSTGLWPRRHI